MSVAGDVGLSSDPATGAAAQPCLGVFPASGAADGWPCGRGAGVDRMPAFSAVQRMHSTRWAWRGPQSEQADSDGRGHPVMN